MSPRAMTIWSLLPQPICANCGKPVAWNAAKEQGTELVHRVCPGPVHRATRADRERILAERNSERP